MGYTKRKGCKDRKRLTRKIKGGIFGIPDFGIRKRLFGKNKEQAEEPKEAIVGREDRHFDQSIEQFMGEHMNRDKNHDLCSAYTYEKDSKYKQELLNKIKINYKKMKEELHIKYNSLKETEKEKNDISTKLKPINENVKEYEEIIRKQNIEIEKIKNEKKTFIIEIYNHNIKAGITVIDPENPIFVSDRLNKLYKNLEEDQKKLEKERDFYNVKLDRYLDEEYILQTNYEEHEEKYEEKLTEIKNIKENLENLEKCMPRSSRYLRYIGLGGKTKKHIKKKMHNRKKTKTKK
jgi:hypothetical protein